MFRLLISKIDTFFLVQFLWKDQISTSVKPVERLTQYKGGTRAFATLNCNSLRTYSVIRYNDVTAEK